MFRIESENLKNKVGKECYHANYTATKDHSPSSSQFSLNTDENSIPDPIHKVRQGTKMNKVVNEIKYIGEIVGMSTIPIDTASLNIEVSSPNYVPGSLEVISRSEYNNYNPIENLDNQNLEQHIYARDDKSCQYEPYHFTQQYINSSVYDISSPQTRRQKSYLLKYSSNERIGTPQITNDHSGSSSIPINTSISQDQVASAGYLASHYDEMQDYRLTPAGGSGTNQYSENTGLVYGYLSATNYEPSTNRVVMNSNTFATRPLLDDNLNRPMQNISHSGVYEDDQLQNHISHLSLQSHNISNITRVASEECADSNGDFSQTLKWRDPNLSEVISFLSSSNNEIVANAAAYLQHLCYMDDPNKQRTRTLGGIPPLIRLLSHEVPEIHKTACGALRNLSYGRQNDENKRAIKNAGGIGGLVKLLCHSQESEVKELVTGVIWNMSSCEDLKRAIIDESLDALLTYVIKPHSGYDILCPGDMCSSTVFRNASGVLRNASSAGEYARTKLRECSNLVECLLYVLRTSITTSNMDSKIVENCVCILRNLSYRCQEVEDPNYDKYPIPNTLNNTLSSSKENLGCFGMSKKKKECFQDEINDSFQGIKRTQSIISPSSKGFEQLWQPDVVQFYLALLQSCSNPETLEAAAGAIQNLAACYWQPSVEIRAAVRKEKGLPILVELLRMEVDRVVCAVATALRNLAIDQRNKELIGKYAMRDLVQKLPSGNPQHDMGTSDDTIAAVLATINEVIRKNGEFSRSLLDAGGIDRLMNIARQRQKYTSCVLKFAGQVLFTMWQHQELREVYKKHGWKEHDFVTKTIAARNAGPNSPNNANSTLNRPMASQGETRYEDRTIKKVSSELEIYFKSGRLSSSKKETTKMYQRAEGQPTSHTWQRGSEDNSEIINPPNHKNGHNHSS